MSKPSLNTLAAELLFEILQGAEMSVLVAVAQVRFVRMGYLRSRQEI